MNKGPLNYFKSKKNIIIFTFILLFLVLSISLFLHYNSKENRSKRYIQNICNDITTINLSINDGKKDLTIDTEKSKELLSNGISDLNNLLTLTSNIDEISTEASVPKETLENAINSTITLYNYILETLNNTQSINNTESIEKLNVFLETCKLNYSELESNDVSLYFPSTTLEYFSSFSSYINTLIKLNRDSSFKNSQISNFINKLDKYNEDISFLNEDLSIAINKIREDGRDLTVIVDDIYKKEETFNKIKEDVNYISIPDGCMEIYDSFLEYLNSYSPYLNSIKESVIYEKTIDNYSDFSKEIEKNYEDSNKKREFILDCYNNYQEKIQQFMY